MPRKKKWDESCLFARLIEADQIEGPLQLSPGDVARIVSVLHELEIRRASTFDAVSAHGYHARSAAHLHHS